MRAVLRRHWVWLAIAAFPILVTADALMGVMCRKSTTAKVEIRASRSGQTRRAIVMFPGYAMPGHPLGEAFAPYVGADDAFVLVSYAERGVNSAQISDEVMATLRTLRPVELRIYGASMGGMLGKLFLDHYRRAGAPYGDVSLILDSAPASARDVKRPSFLFSLSCWYRGGPLSSAVLAMINKAASKPPTGSDAFPEVVRAAHDGGAWVGMSAATSQACFIAKFPPLRKAELVDSVREVVYLQGSSPEDDPVVNISSAIAGWRVAFPALMIVTVPGREGRWHLPLVESPRETARVISAP
jgi:hypothetical protein